MKRVDCKVQWEGESSAQSSQHLVWNVFTAHALPFQIDLHLTPQCLLFTSTNAVKSFFANESVQKVLPSFGNASTLIWLIGCVGTETEACFKQLLRPELLQTCDFITNAENTGLAALLQKPEFMKCTKLILLTGSEGRSESTLALPEFKLLKQNTTVMHTYRLVSSAMVPPDVQDLIKNSDSDDVEFRCRSGKVLKEVVGLLRKSLGSDVFEKLRFGVWGASTLAAMKELSIEAQCNVEN